MSGPFLAIGTNVMQDVIARRKRDQRAIKDRGVGRVCWEASEVGRNEGGLLASSSVSEACQRWSAVIVVRIRGNSFIHHRSQLPGVNRG